MKLKNISVSNIYKYTFFGIVLFYCLVLSQYGMETWDTGYISSFSWKIVNGQNPYEDFVYKFPPVSIYLHAFFMKILPENGQFFYFRIINYLFFAFQIYFVVSGFLILYDKVKFNKWSLCIVCFMVSWISFCAFPWPTTDSLFFASIAFWLICTNKNISTVKLFFIAICSLLAALSKQSFYMIPFVFLIWISIRYSVKKGIIYFIFLSLFFGAFYLFINKISSWEKYCSQTNGELRLYDLFYVGIHNYIFIPIKLFIAIIFVLFVSIWCYLKYKKKKISFIEPYVKWLAVGIFCISLLTFYEAKNFVPQRMAFDASCIGVFYLFFFKNKTIQYITPLIVLLSISWSVSISLGFPSPTLFSTGIILSFLLFIIEVYIPNRKLILFISIIICLTAFSFSEYQYREDSIFKLKYSLDEISPKLKYIKTKKATFEKHLELKNLIVKYGENFIVAPNFCQANYIFNHQSELPSDWIIDTEINRKVANLIRLSSDPKNYIFMEKSFVNFEDFPKEETPKTSSVAWFIYKKFQPLEETNYFIVYNSIKKDEELP
jgi:hypothetical protein